MALDILRMHANWWAQDGARIGLAGVITIAFALLGYLVRGVNASGALAGGLICLALFASVGPGAFAGLLAVFVVTWIATRIGRPRKLSLGTAERREGRRASQVFANLGVAAACALAYSLRGEALWLLASASAMAEAAADTVSSELGQAFSRRALLITSLERVPPGTDGGVSIRGTASGVAAAILVGAACAVAGMVPQRWAVLAALAGVLGMLADSLLGAWFERAHRIDNDTVNFASTLVAAACGGILGSLFS